MTLSKTKSLVSANSNSSTQNYQECADCGAASKKHGFFFFKQPRILVFINASNFKMLNGRR